MLLARLLGKWHGKFKYFDDDGILADSFTYYNGEMTGHADYYKNGQIKTHWVYKDNKVITKSFYFDDGDISCKLLYHKKNLIVYKYYHNNGKLYNYSIKVNGGLWDIIRHYKTLWKIIRHYKTYKVKSIHFYKDTDKLEIKHFDENGDLIIK